MTRQEVAKRIAGRREYLQHRHGGYTQEEVARKLGWTRQRYGLAEQGRRNIPSQELKDIARALECETSYLLDEIGIIDSLFVQEERDLIHHYREADPPIRQAARAVLQVKFREDDSEDTTDGKNAGD